MKCSKCQFENQRDAKFCNQCASKLELACPGCGTANLPGSRFCKECAYDLSKPEEAPPIDYTQPQSYTPKFLAEKILTTRSSIEGERKLVTVLFADVANYTSMSEKLDPEEVHQIMDGCFKILMDEIHRYEGTINQFTGDGVMALFGAPVAHEDHGQRACHAALSIQKAIEGYSEKVRGQHGAEFKMRIGLNSGPVIVGSIGDDLRMDYTAVGDTTNLAHRMQTEARPGSVLVSGNTHKLAGDFFECASLGELPLKGKVQPQEAHELIRPAEVETRIEAAMAKGLTRFVGRNREIETLKEAFESAKSGAGQVIGIVGEAGVGKSRLLLELRRLLPEGEYSYLEGRCLHYGGSMPYLPVLDFLKAYLDIEEEDRERAIKEKLRGKLLELDASMSTVPPALHEVLSLNVEDERYVQLGPQQRRERTFEAIRDLVVRESQKKPLVLAVEDLHWIDKTSEEFLNYLIGFLPTVRILLILLYRPEYTHMWGSMSYYGKVGLDQLPAQTSAELVQAILEGGEVAPEIAGLVLGRAGGNPLFVEELTHSLLENGSIKKEENQFVLTHKPSEIEVPDTIQGIIAARMDRVEEDLKRIIQVASVIGREFAYRILQEIMGVREGLKTSLLNLQGLEFIYEKQIFPELEYIFKHALTQEVAYNSLLLKRRKEIHERIGQAIEQLYAERLEEYYEFLAYHYVRTDNKEKALEYLDMANRKAVRVYALEDGKAYFEEAMKIIDTLPDSDENRQFTVRLLRNQATLFEWLFEMQDYYDWLLRYESACTNVSNPAVRGTYYACVGYCEYTFGAISQAISRETEAIALCKSVGETQDLGLAYTLLVGSYFLAGDFEQVFAFEEEVMGIMDIRFDLFFYVRALCIAGWAHCRTGEWEEALRKSQKALRAAQDFSDNSHTLFAHISMAYLSNFVGDLDRAEEHVELAMQIPQTPADEMWVKCVLAQTLCQNGEADRAIEILDPIVEVARASRHLITHLIIFEALAEAYLLTGDFNRARETTIEIQQFAEQNGAKLYSGCAYRLLGEIALRTDPDQAVPYFNQAISIFKDIRAPKDLAVSYVGMGRYHKQQGNAAEARRYLTDALETFERLGTLIEPDKVRKELAELPQ